MNQYSHTDKGLIEVADAMGFSKLEIIFSVYLKESITGITRVTMITFVSFIGITAIAGAIGAGSIGDFAVCYGYQMGYRDMIWLTVIVILIMISIFQFIGNLIIKNDYSLSSSLKPCLLCTDLISTDSLTKIKAHRLSS